MPVERLILDASFFECARNAKQPCFWPVTFDDGPVSLFCDPRDQDPRSSASSAWQYNYNSQIVQELGDYGAMGTFFVSALARFDTELCGDGQQTLMHVAFNQTA